MTKDATNGEREALPKTVSDTDFEGWLSCHEPNRNQGRVVVYSKQDMRESYWAGFNECAAIATRAALASRPAEPITLDGDPKRQELFGSAIDGAMAFGYQNVNPPPDGHWLTKWWEKGREWAEEVEKACARPAEPVRPDLLEKLTYHRLERDDLTLDECLSMLAFGWKKVRGRTDRQLVLQITALLSAEPSVEPRAAGLSDERDNAAEEQIDAADLAYWSAYRDHQPCDDDAAHRAGLVAVLAAASPQPGAAQGDCGNADCGWRGPLSECSELRSRVGSAVGPLCPKCREIVQPNADPVPTLAVPRGLSEQAVDGLKAEANEIFNNPPSDTAQEVRDAIEWYDASLRVALAAAGSKR